MKKLRAGAMYYALMVAVIIGIMSGSLILYNYLSVKQSIHLQLQKRTVNNVLSAINLLTANSTLLQPDESSSITLFDDENQQVYVSKKTWGGFELISATAKYNAFTFTKSALVGSFMPTNNDEVLYLADLNKPLSLCGKTEIVGSVQLPASGVQRAYIEGQSFMGTKLIDGKVSNSTKSLPEIKENIIQENTKFLSKQFGVNDSVVGLEVFEKDTIIRSFYDKTLAITSNQISLLKGFYSGNIRIVADEIIVGSEVQLKDVVLYASKIIIEKGFEGSLQVFASDSMVIESDVNLQYPSSLVIIGNAKSSSLYLGENCKVSGVVMAYQQQNTTNDTYFSIGKNTIITGQVYCNGSIDLKGSVYGNVVCKKFVLKTPSSVYENHLLNAVIDRTKLPKEFVGINLLADNESRNLVAWLE